jgi:hypothetical protein
VGAELFHADGKMDRLTDRYADGKKNVFRDFAKAPKNTKAWTNIYDLSGILNHGPSI